MTISVFVVILTALFAQLVGADGPRGTGSGGGVRVPAEKDAEGFRGQKHAFAQRSVARNDGGRAKVIGNKQEKKTSVVVRHLEVMFHCTTAWRQQRCRVLVRIKYFVDDMGMGWERFNLYLRDRQDRRSTLCFAWRGKVLFS